MSKRRVAVNLGKQKQSVSRSDMGFPVIFGRAAECNGLLGRVVEMTGRVEALRTEMAGLKRTEFIHLFHSFRRNMPLDADNGSWDCDSSHRICTEFHLKADWL